MQKDSMLTNKIKGAVALLNKNSLLSDVAIMIICCAAGVFAKKIINPFANVVTDSLHVPGGISTAISLMFLVIASGITKRRCSASMMGLAQAIMALALGSVGSMGFLLPLAYVIPAVVIDLVMLIPGKGRASIRTKAFFANMISSVSAALFAEIVVFHLPLRPLTVYILLAALSGAIAGYLAGAVIHLIVSRND